MRTIALYLPQFHTIPENDQWWGKGFTEWVNIKKAKPLYEGHNQPRIPLNNNYYDLSDIEVMKWQVKIAKDNGIYGFCFYHYWFTGKLLLEKPVENFLHSNIDFHYCLSWANEHWTNQWVSDKWDVLIEQKYGNEKEWGEHFDYLLQYFQDPRYIKYEEKPVFVIYRPDIIDKRKEMLAYWNKLAREHNFPGICFVFQRSEFLLNSFNNDMKMFDFCAAYQPVLAQTQINLKGQHFILARKLKRSLFRFIEQHSKFDARSVVLTKLGRNLTIYDYDEIWKEILNEPDIFSSMIASAFVDWDNTPRRGKRGSVIIGGSPEKFEKYLELLIKKSRVNYKTDLLFIFAWNEWAEGGYLEPDEKNGYGYLNAIKKALINTNELPGIKNV